VVLIIVGVLVVLCLAAVLAGGLGALYLFPLIRSEGAAPTAVAVTQAPLPSPTPSAEKDTATRPPAALPSREPAARATPAADLEDLSLYRADLRPEFAGDVEAAPDATRYFIEVTLDPDDPTALSGVQRVRYTNTEDAPLDALLFRLYPNMPGFGGSMDVDQVVLEGEVVAPVLETDDTALRVPLDPPLARGSVVDLTLWFRAGLPSNTSAGYGVFAFADDVYALAGFYPTIPVYDDEGWNVEIAPGYGDATFTDVAFYQVRLTVPADLTVVTSGSVLQDSDNGDGTRTWTAAGGPIRDFYVAMSADYDMASEDVDGTRVTSYYRSGQTAGGELALEYAVDSLRVFNERFGPYPYTELDVIATPTNAGGIEYPGAIVVAQGLYDQQGGFFEMATAHEVAHQWWYGLVGNDQLDEPWLDEALTNYSAYVYYQDIDGDTAAQRIKESVFERPYQIARQEGWDRPVAGPVASFEAQEYGAIVYGKGPLFFDAVREELGDEDFFAALQTYLESHRYGVAYPEDLIEAFEETSGRQIDDLYAFWILGETQ
jgi:hypothetical protein